jgi:hypothetical protein
MVSRQYTYREVAACLGVTNGAVANWVANFEQQWRDGLPPRRRLGRPAELSEEELLLLDDLVDAGAFEREASVCDRVPEGSCAGLPVSRHIVSHVRGRRLTNRYLFEASHQTGFINVKK